MVKHELLTRTKNRIKRSMPLVPTFEVTEDLVAGVDAVAEQAEKPIYQVRPYVEEGGVREAIPILKRLHETQRSMMVRDVTPTSAAELWYDHDDIFSVNLVPGSADLGGDLRAQLREEYPNTEIRQRGNRFLPMDPGQSFCGARFGLLRGPHLPVQNAEMKGFGGTGNSVRDPHKDLVTAITDNSGEDVSVMVQTALRPREESLALKKRRSMAASSLKAGDDPSKKDRNSASYIQNQNNRDVFDISIRLLCVSDDPSAARSRLRSIIGEMTIYDEPNIYQGFAPEAVYRYRPFLKECAERSPSSGRENIVTDRGAAGLAHLPSPDVTHEAIERTTSKAGKAIPPGFPNYDLREYGLDPELADEIEKWNVINQPANQEDGDPWPLGFGSRLGDVFSIYDGDFHHTAWTGKTRYGKTEGALGLYDNAVGRGHTAAYLDPKSGEDAKTALKYAMDAGREIYPIRLGSDTDHRLGFNLLEVPGNPEPGTKAYEVGLESMADIVEGVLRQADDNTTGEWGTRMSRMTRHLCRAIGKLDLSEPATLLTLFYAVTEREDYAERVVEEDIPFLRKTAEDVFANYSDEQIEPWMGRMQQVVESDPIREMACVTDSLSFSDMIQSGGALAAYAEQSSTTAMKMLMGGFIPRYYTEFTLQYMNPALDDPPETHLFADELNDVITPSMNFPKMLSNGAGYGFHVHGIMQDLDSQAGREVEQAFKGQARNISLNSGPPEFGRTMAKLHDDYSATDMTSLPKYTAIARAHDKKNGVFSDLHSVKVNLGHPRHEIDDSLPSDEEVEEMVDRREREVGQQTRSAQEIMEQTLFSPEYDGPSDAAAAVPGMDPDDVEDAEIEADQNAPGDLSVAETAAACKAVLYASTSEHDGLGYLPFDDVAGEIASAVADARGKFFESDFADADDVWRNTVQRIDAIDSRESSDGVFEVAPTEDVIERISDVGTSTGSGGPLHAEIMKDALLPLAVRDLVMAVERQGGSDAEPDAVLSPDRILNLSDDPSPTEIHAAVDRLQEEHPVANALTHGEDAYIESEKSTGNSKAGQTVKNTADAFNRDLMCLLLCRPEISDNVWSTVAEEPRFARSDHSVDGERRYYNLGGLSVNGEPVYYRGDSMTVWIRDDESGDVIHYDGEGTEHARFDSVDDVFDDRDDQYLYADDDGVDPEAADVHRVKEPVIPEHLFDSADPEEWPTHGEDFRLIEVPRGAEPGDLRDRDHQGTRPLDALDPEWSADGETEDADHSDGLEMDEKTAEDVFDRLEALDD